jgi:hypothetical protein
LKLPLLLSQYLREQKTLSLPGIGIFNLTGTISPDDEAIALNSSQVTFESKRIKEPDEKLLSYIKQETGKIRPLAIADLECFVATGMEMLNMGKPFELDGIGSIQKKKDGQLEFVAGPVLMARQDMAHSDHHEKKVSVFEDSKYEPRSNPLQKILAFGLLLAGLAVVLLGGYYLYNKSNNVEPIADDETRNSTPIQQPAIDTIVSKPDTAQIAKLPSTYKFILETTSSKARALKRYNQLKSMAIDVKMDTADSMNFKLYLVIPATAADTTRIKDSLHNYYGRRVVVEK